MVLSERDKTLFGAGANGFGRGAATKAMLGFNPVSTMPNYSVGMGVNGAQQPTYRPNMNGANGRGSDEKERNPQSIAQGTYQMIDTRIGAKHPDVDGPIGND